MNRSTAYKLNIPGDFYVEDGCCMACAVPFDVAPNLFEWDDLHCYIKKQPMNDAELEQMVNTFQVAEAGCIRYKGNDRSILALLVEAGEGNQCDVISENAARSK